jgi:hypothetical protein
MQHFCTRCGNPRRAGETACAWCGTQFSQPAEPQARADPPIPVYEEPQPTTWDYSLPSDSGPQSWNVGYYDEPQRLAADERDPFWSVFPAPPAPTAEAGHPAPSWQALPDGAPSWQQPTESALPWLVPPQPGPQSVSAQPAARQPGAHRLVPARPETRNRHRPSLGRPSGTLAAAAVLLVLACGGGAYALVTTLTGHSGKAGGHPADAAGLSTAPAAQASSLPSATPPGTPAATAPVAASPAASATTPPAVPATQPPPTEPVTTQPPETQPPPSGTVAVTVSPGAQSDSAEPQVLAWIESYFTAINEHDYQAYISLLDAHDAANESPADFSNGYSSTTDSAITLTGISDLGNGGEAAAVTFRSHQDPSQSIDGSSCDVWSITLYLTPSGSSYVKVSPPPGYQSSHRAC